MPRHEERRTLAYTADALFSVVADVKDYPSFVPWCSGARIHCEDPQEIIADFAIGFGPLRESFTSHVTLDRPRHVLVRATEGGPLEHLTNRWTFTAGAHGFQATHPDELRGAIAEAFAVDGPAIVDCIVATDEMPNVPHIDLGLAKNYAVAKIKEAVIAATGP